MQGWSQVWWKKQPPARPGNAHRDAAHQHQQQDSPPDACSGVSDGKRSRPDRKPDETGDSEQPRSHAGVLEHSWLSGLIQRLLVASPLPSIYSLPEAFLVGEYFGRKEYSEEGLGLQSRASSRSPLRCKHLGCSDRSIEASCRRSGRRLLATWQPRRAWLAPLLLFARGPLVVIGHSMGARVALEMVRAAPERISSSALLDTGVHPVREGEEATADPGRSRIRARHGRAGRSLAAADGS